ncbi:MAG: hypothetical protein GEV07_06090 [Streptosporangiales bacterium]|nr:hypothetical protein [Streptosporangiales bacterium]
MSDAARLKWERATEWPLLVLAALFLGAYAVDVLYTGPSQLIPATAQVVNIGVWLLFVVDYVVRLGLAAHRWKFVTKHLLDLTIIVLPFLRPLRVLRVVVVLGVLDRRLRGTFRRRAVLYVTTAVGLIVFVGALAVLDAERGAPGATIADLGDAVWWALATVTTVGYGDQFPVTVAGRFVAGGMMIAGISLLGVITATLASWFMEHVEEMKVEEQETQDSLGELTAEVRRLREEVRALRAGAAQDRSG